MPCSSCSFALLRAFECLPSGLAHMPVKSETSHLFVGRFFCTLAERMCLTFLLIKNSSDDPFLKMSRLNNYFLYFIRQPSR